MNHAFRKIALVLIGSIPLVVSPQNDPDRNVVPSSSDFKFSETLWMSHEGNSKDYLNSTELSEVVTINPPGGFYYDPVKVTLRAESSDTDIYYSLDGSVPTEASLLYREPIEFSRTGVIRVRTYRQGHPQSAVLTHTYILNPSFSLPVVSLVTDSLNLWGKNGIFTFPRHEWEKPVHIEYFESNGSPGFSLDGGMRVHADNGNKQKSFRLYARPEYGISEIHYRIFSNKDIDSFKRLILRNAANDGLQFWTNRTHFRDGLLHTLYNKIDDKKTMSSYKPVHVFLIGNYWGIYNLRERQDKYYIESNFGETNIDFLERVFNSPGNRNAIEGYWGHYDMMTTFIDTADLTKEANYDYVKTLMDVEDFLDYWMFEVYAGNFDWLTNNIRFWRSKIPAGKWRWLLWDLDHGIGLPYTYGGVKWGDPDCDHLAWSTGTTGPRSGGVNTVIIRNLLENSEARYYFINRFADLLNLYLSPPFVESVLDSIYERLSLDIHHQMNRWGSTLIYWNEAVDCVRNYINVRPSYVRSHIMEKFHIDSKFTIQLNVQPPSSGYILMNTIFIDAFPWYGDYFSNIPVTIRAIPTSGYRFTGWSGIADNVDRLTALLVSDTLVTALFESIPANSSTIVINEINYHSAEIHDSEDWIELFNPGPVYIDLSAWQLKDNDDEHTFIFPDGFFLAPDEYVVVCRDTQKFSTFFPNTHHYIGNFDFGLSSRGDQVRIFNQNGFLIDSVQYTVTAPWPTTPNGKGPTLELNNPLSDNSLPIFWSASTGYGSPSSSNQKPDRYFLAQNYPNPFNTSTVISYDLPERSNVTIRIYNVMGRLVKRIEGGNQERGRYSVIWNATDSRNEAISTGIYFYQIQAGKFSEVRKCLIVK